MGVQETKGRYLAAIRQLLSARTSPTDLADAFDLYAAGLRDKHAENLVLSRTQSSFAELLLAALRHLETPSLAQKALAFITTLLAFPESEKSLKAEQQHKILTELVSVMPKMVGSQASIARIFLAFPNTAVPRDILRQHVIVVMQILETFTANAALMDITSPVPCEMVKFIQWSQTTWPEESSESMEDWLQSLLNLAIHKDAKVRDKALAVLDKAVQSGKTIHPKLLQKDKLDEVVRRMNDLVRGANGSPRQEMPTLQLWNLLFRLFANSLNDSSQSGLVNSLLKVVEVCFKGSDKVKVGAFSAWRTLIETFALDGHALRARNKMRLILQPLLHAPSSSEAVAAEKLKTWWRFVRALPSDFLEENFETIVIPLIRFCLGGRLDTVEPAADASAIKDSFGKKVTTPVTPKSPGLHLLTWTPKFNRKSLGPTELPVHTDIQAKVGAILTALLVGEMPAKSGLDPLEGPVVTQPLTWNHHGHFLFQAMRLWAAACPGDSALLPPLVGAAGALLGGAHDASDWDAQAQDFARQLHCLLAEGGADEAEAMLATFAELLPTDHKLRLTDDDDGSVAALLLDDALRLLRPAACDGVDQTWVTLVSRLASRTTSSESEAGVWQTALRSVVSEEADVWLSVAGALDDARRCGWAEFPLQSGKEAEWATFLAAPLLQTRGLPSDLGTAKTLETQWSSLCAYLSSEMTSPNKFLESVFALVKKSVGTKLIQDVGRSYLCASALGVGLSHMDFAAVKEQQNDAVDGELSLQGGEWDGSFGCLGALAPFASVLEVLLSSLAKFESDKESSEALFSGALSEVLASVAKVFEALEAPSQLSSLAHKIAPALGALVALSAAADSAALFKGKMPKLETAVATIWRRLLSDFGGPWDNSLLQASADLLAACLSHSRKGLRVEAESFWNKTFAKASTNLSYPPTLKTILRSSNLVGPGLMSGAGEPTDSPRPHSDASTGDKTKLVVDGKIQVKEPQIHLPGGASPAKHFGSLIPTLHNKDAPKEAKSSPSTDAAPPIDDMDTTDFVAIEPTEAKRYKPTQHQKEKASERKDMPFLEGDQPSESQMVLPPMFEESMSMSQDVIPSSQEVEESPAPPPEKKRSVGRPRKARKSIAPKRPAEDKADKEDKKDKAEEKAAEAAVISTSAAEAAVAAVASAPECQVQVQRMEEEAPVPKASADQSTDSEDGGKPSSRKRKQDASEIKHNEPQKKRTKRALAKRSKTPSTSDEAAAPKAHAEEETHNAEEMAEAEALAKELASDCPGLFDLMEGTTESQEDLDAYLKEQKHKRQKARLEKENSASFKARRQMEDLKRKIRSKRHGGPASPQKTKKRPQKAELEPVPVPKSSSEEEEKEEEPEEIPETQEEDPEKPAEKVPAAVEPEVVEEVVDEPEPSFEAMDDTPAEESVLSPSEPPPAPPVRVSLERTPEKSESAPMPLPKGSTGILKPPTASLRLQAADSAQKAALGRHVHFAPDNADRSQSDDEGAASPRRHKRPEEKRPRTLDAEEGSLFKKNKPADTQFKKQFSARTLELISKASGKKAEPSAAPSTAPSAAPVTVAAAASGGDLTECTAPISGLLPQLTTAVLRRGLEMMLKGAGVTEIGHLARLPEAKISELPFHNPRVATVRRVLTRYAENHPEMLTKAPSEEAEPVPAQLEKEAEPVVYTILDDSQDDEDDLPLKKLSEVMSDSEKSAPVSQEAPEAATEDAAPAEEPNNNDAITAPASEFITTLEDTDSDEKEDEEAPPVPIPEEDEEEEQMEAEKDEQPIPEAEPMDVAEPAAPPNDIVIEEEEDVPEPVTVIEEVDDDDDASSLDRLSDFATSLLEDQAEAPAAEDDAANKPPPADAAPPTEENAINYTDFLAEIPEAEEEKTVEETSEEGAMAVEPVDALSAQLDAGLPLPRLLELQGRLLSLCQRITAEMLHTS